MLETENWRVFEKTMFVSLFKFNLNSAVMLLLEAPFAVQELYLVVQCFQNQSFCK